MKKQLTIKELKSLIKEEAQKLLDMDEITREAVHRVEESGIVFLDEIDKIALKQAVKGSEIRYIDWMFPGILGMNMMFSALFGVGYVMVLYRKNGVLKRLKATPLTAFEYLSEDQEVEVVRATTAIQKHRFQHVDQFS